MKNLSVGIFHDPDLGRELGKKGTESDFAMFNRKSEDHILTFLSPVGDKLSAKSQIMSGIDAAVVTVNTITPELGETILMLDMLHIQQGVFLVPPYTDTAPIKRLITGTSLGSYAFIERKIPDILSVLQRINPTRDTQSSTIVSVDHSFSVKGVGEVLLGFVKKGIVSKHQTLQLLPLNKEVVVRSIQMQDSDVDSAEAGSRVGLAIKGATAEEMIRGSLLCPTDSAFVTSSLDVTFTPNRYYTEPIKEGLYHITVGMQTVPGTISSISNETLHLQLEKPVVYTQEDMFLLMNLNAKKLHLIGHGTARPSF